MERNIKEYLENIRSRALSALDKSSPYGLNLDLTSFIRDKGEVLDVRDYADKLINVGIDLSRRDVASYYQVDNIPVNTHNPISGVKVLNLNSIFSNEDLVLNYYWKALPVDFDKYTAIAELIEGEGYVIIADKNVKVDRPIQTCLILHKPKLIQAPHNIIVAGENSEIHVVTGCMTALGAEGLHAGVTEFYIGRNATVTYTMIHNWSRRIHVRPRTAAIIEDGGKLVMHYINFSPVASLQTYPRIILRGDNGRAYSSSILIGKLNSILDVGSSIVLNGDNSSGEIISRIIATDNSKVISRAKIVGEARNVKGHVECSGLLLTDNSEIITIPELDAKVRDIQLTHEAAVGRISEDEIIYLMARGFSRSEAESMIVRGFMEVSLKDLPEILMISIRRVLDLVAEKL